MCKQLSMDDIGYFLYMQSQEESNDEMLEDTEDETCISDGMEDVTG